MNKLIIYIVIVSLLSFSCKKTEPIDEVGRVVVTGKVNEFNGENSDLFLVYSQPGLKRQQIPIELNGQGRFRFELETTIPLDAMILEKKTFANINFIYHPNDSIHIEFTAKNSHLPLLSSVKFTGDSEKDNNQLIAFQQLREEKNLGYGAIDLSAINQNDINGFIQKMDSLKQKQLNLFNRFAKDNSLSKEALEWTQSFATETYFYFLDMYAYDHENISKNYYNYNHEILPLTTEKLVCWSVITSRVSSYWGNTVKKDFQQKYIDKIEEIKSGKIDSDSLVIDYVETNIQDKLLQDLLIANYYTIQMGANILEGYQKNQEHLYKSINTPLIEVNLNKSYQVAYHFVNKPHEYTNEVLKKIEDTPISDTFSKILSENTGKVIYIDCWATWCSPCIKAMPHSKKLMEKYKGKDVSFVYICIDSSEKLWERMVSEFNLGGGQHYLLNKEQSDFFRESMDVQGIPEYFLIDKEKNIMERGNHIHPGGILIEEKMNTLLN